MKTEIGLRKEMIGRVVKIAKDREFAAPESYLHERFTELEAVGEELRVAAGRQAAAELGFREHALVRSVASAKLQEWLADVAALARALPVARFPGVAARFRMPRSQSYQEQHAHTIAFIKALRELEHIFTPRGIDEEAIAQAEDLLEQIETANGAKITRFLRRIEYTEKLMLISRRGLAIVREIDAILQRKLRPNPALLAEWNSARHVHRPRKKRAAKSSPPSPPPE